MRVMMVGSAEQSGGGVASVIRLIKKMPVWEKYNCYWLGTQIQRNYLWKVWYAVKAWTIALFIIWRYDVVHFHTTPDRFGLWIQMPVFLLAYIYDKKIVMHLHIGNQLWQNTCNNLFKWVLKHSNAVVLLADKWLKLYEELYADINTSGYVIYNACDSVDAIDYKLHDKYILMAGAINWNKACDTLVEAFARIHERFPDWKVILLGSGPDEEKICTLTMRHGLQNKVLMPGYLFGEDVKEYFRKAGIYCMSSKLEGFPMVVLEAWSYGVPVVTTPVGGLPDVIEETKNCLTFEDYKNDEMLAIQLARLIEDEELRFRMSEYSKSFVKNQFSLEVVNKSYEEFYEHIQRN